MSLDPFYDELHQRLPEVRVILLPPETPNPTEPVETLTPEEAARRATSGRTTARDNLASLWAVASAGRPQPPQVRHAWDAGNEPGVVIAQAQARHEGSVGDVRGDLTSVRERLAEEGWAVTTHPVGKNGTRLAATRGETRLDVVVWGSDGPWDVTVGVPAPVGDQATTLRAGGTVTTPWNAPTPKVAL